MQGRANYWSKRGRKELIFPSSQNRSRQNSCSPPSVLCLPTSRTGSISEGSGRLTVTSQPEDRRELLAVIEAIQPSLALKAFYQCGVFLVRHLSLVAQIDPASGELIAKFILELAQA